MRVGLIILGIIIIGGMWFITNTQMGKNLPYIGQLTGRMTSLPSLQPIAYIVGFLILLMGLFLGKKTKDMGKKTEDDEEEFEGEEEPEEEPTIEEE